MHIIQRRLRHVMKALTNRARARDFDREADEEEDEDSLPEDERGFRPNFSRLAKEAPNIDLIHQAVELVLIEYIVCTFLCSSPFLFPIAMISNTQPSNFLAHICRSILKRVHTFCEMYHLKKKTQFV